MPRHRNSTEIAHQRIDDHEKLCRIMQKQTQKQIDKLAEEIIGLKKWMIGSAGTIIVLLLGIISTLLKIILS